MTFNVKKYVDNLFTTGYSKKELKYHSKQINKIRKKGKKKGKKKKALKKQFKYMNKMIEHGQQRKGVKKTPMMSQAAINVMNILNDGAINDVWNNSNVPMYNGYANAYHTMHRLDRIESMMATKHKPKPKPKKRSNIHTIHDWK